ncbi:hypothetical protein EKL29_20030 [Pantoea sp. YU22]|uniref:polysaccharide pyruvyl transferase family protein n=1 Tax=Pantoea TaxID=53335 RepID=UPI000F89A7FE|nr:MULTISPECIES: polysaccharide pyruvyl transferase family protein [Pantoea]RTY54524.1 hypothetical protein EKL29_20030 [Pantoea sp. YU22]
MTSYDLDLESLLKFYHSKHNLVYKANPGNAGDGVIASATYDFFKQHGLNYEQYRVSNHYDPNKDVLIFGGGGNLIEGLYAEGMEFISRNQEKFSKIVIMPSTIKGYEEFFKRGVNKFLVFCRENISYEYILSLGYIAGESVFLADDMAFYLDLPSYLSYVDPFKGVANCYRTDSESLTKSYKENNHDISLTWNGDYWDNEYLARNSSRCMINFLEEYDTINTDRLHVAILGSLLGKEVNFFPNSYYKNESVYKYSLLNRYPKTVFLSAG